MGLISFTWVFCHNARVCTGPKNGRNIFAFQLKLAEDFLERQTEVRNLRFFQIMKMQVKVLTLKDPIRDKLCTSAQTDHYLFVRFHVWKVSDNTAQTCRLFYDCYSFPSDFMYRKTPITLCTLAGCSMSIL